MSNKKFPDDIPRNTMLYQFRFKGHIDEYWKNWFQGGEITLEKSGYTLMTCTVVDYAALYGLIKKLRDLGLNLHSAIRVD